MPKVSQDRLYLLQKEWDTAKAASDGLTLKVSKLSAFINGKGFPESVKDSQDFLFSVAKATGFNVQEALLAHLVQAGLSDNTNALAQLVLDEQTFAVRMAKVTNTSADKHLAAGLKEQFTARMSILTLRKEQAEKATSAAKAAFLAEQEARKNPTGVNPTVAPPITTSDEKKKEEKTIA